MHAVVLHYPRWLYRYWEVQDIKNILPSSCLTNSIPWFDYLPFVGVVCSINSIKKNQKWRLLLLDSLLFIFFLLLFQHFDTEIYWLSSAWFTAILLVSSYVDAEYQLLPDELTYLLLWTGLALSCWNIYTYSMSAILGVIVAYSILWVIATTFKYFRKKEGMGAGDFKLLAAITAWTGLMHIPVILFCACALCLFFIFLRHGLLGKNYADPIAFGPFLAFSGWLTLLWGDKIVNYLRF